MQTITAFILYFIIPKFEAIFKDFGVSLPAGHDLGHRRHSFPHQVRLLSRFWSCSSRSALLVFLPLSFLAWGNYTIPLFDRLLGRRHTALVLRSLALIVEGGKPIALGLSTLAQPLSDRAGSAAGCCRVETEVQAGGRLDRVAQALPA